ncbi:hypothetical protein CHUAL_009924 [Chamberlinius hualienensis]
MNKLKHSCIIGEIAASNGGGAFQWTKDIEERNKLWDQEARFFVSSDTCVPISQLPKIIEETQKDIESQNIIGPILGHVGDGNFHAFMLFDPNESSELQRIKGICDRLAERAWKVGGTCTGEHGIGLGKMHLLDGEVGKEGVNIMKLIKRSFDPLNILNPGKVIDVSV